MTGTRPVPSPGRPRAKDFLGRTLLALGAFGSLSITGCATQPPQAPAASMIHVRAAEPGSTRSGSAFTPGAWPRETWWRFFGDQDLDRLMADALGANPGLAAARARLEAAEATVRETRARLMPRVGAEAGLEGEYFSATGEHSLLNGRSVLFGRLNPVQAVYNPDISGQNGHALAAAVGEVRVKKAQQAAARLDISTALARVWFGAAELDGALAAEKRRLALTRRLVAVQNVRLSSGLEDADAVFAARQAQAELRRRIRLDQGRRAGLLAAAAALAGQPPSRTAGLRPIAPALGRFPVPDDVPLGLLRHRPDVMAALWEVEAARQGVSAAHAAFYPQLNLALFAGWNSIHLADLLNPANFARGLGLALSLPIFEGGALRAQLAAARARYDLAVDHYNQRVLASVKEVAAGLASWKANHDALVQTRAGVAAARGRLRLRNAALRAGLTNAVPTIKADISASAQEELQVRQQASTAQTWVDLVAALGGGYPPRAAGRPSHPGQRGVPAGPPAARRAAPATNTTGRNGGGSGRQGP